MRVTGGVIGGATCNRAVKPTDVHPISKDTPLIYLLSLEDTNKNDWLYLVLMDVVSIAAAAFVAGMLLVYCSCRLGTIMLFSTTYLHMACTQIVITRSIYRIILQNYTQLKLLTRVVLSLQMDLMENNSWSSLIVIMFTMASS